jgi:tRNA G18 (ribose-2'-O)-methylase SpoU
LEHCTDTVTINGSGNAESLNAAISASIILYEWCA